MTNEQNKVAAVTGHSAGIGLELSQLLRARGFTVKGFSRSNGYDLAEAGTSKRIIAETTECSIFINNAFHEWTQVDLLYAMFAEWKLTSKLIINISSNSADMTKSYEHKYAAAKSALDVACTQLNHVLGASCRVINLRPGWVRTRRSEGLASDNETLGTADISQIVEWLLDLPAHIHVPSMTVIRR